MKSKAESLISVFEETVSYSDKSEPACAMQNKHNNMKWTSSSSIRGNNMNSIGLLALVVVSALVVALVSLEAKAQDDFSSSFGSYLNQARSLLDTGMAFQQQQQQPVPSLMPNEDPRVTRLLSDSIKMATGSSSFYFFFWESAEASEMKVCAGSHI